LAAAALMLALPQLHDLRPGAAWGEFGGELAGLEARVAAQPDDLEARRELGEAYAARGLAEEAVAQYVAILSRKPGEDLARARARELIEKQMPAWLPERVEKVGVFGCEVLEMALRPGGGGRRQEIGQEQAPAQQGGKARYRLIVTKEEFAAREGERFDHVHEKLFARIDYGYVWEGERGRWEMKVRVHWGEDEATEVAREALRATLAFHCVVRDYLGFDPTRPWGKPVDVWLLEEGQPGARAVGRSMYLYGMKRPREAAEWVREVAHEYGHIALPGIGGFTEMDDPWADGELGELLFPKWLAASGVPEWMPWSVEGWEREARARREELMKGAAGAPDQSRLERRNEAARDYLLGLALLVEKEAGPGFLGEALRRSPRGSAEQFVEAVRLLGRERGISERLCRD